MMAVSVGKLSRPIWMHPARTGSSHRKSLQLLHSTAISRQTCNTWGSLLVWYNDFITVMRAVKVSSSCKVLFVQRRLHVRNVKVLVGYLSALDPDGITCFPGFGPSAKRAATTWYKWINLFDTLKTTYVYKALQMLYKTVIQLILLHSTDRGFVINRMHEQWTNISA